MTADMSHGLHVTGSRPRRLVVCNFADGTRCLLDGTPYEGGAKAMSVVMYRDDVQFVLQAQEQARALESIAYLLSVETGQKPAEVVDLVRTYLDTSDRLLCDRDAVTAALESELQEWRDMTLWQRLRWAVWP